MNDWDERKLDDPYEGVTWSVSQLSDGPRKIEITLLPQHSDETGRYLWLNETDLLAMAAAIRKEIKT